MTRPYEIIVVEDEPVLAQLLADELAEYEFAVIGMPTTVASALQAIAAHPAVDAVVLDMNLLGQRCWPVAAELQARGIPFLFMSGYGRGEVPTSFRTVPFVDKPAAIGEVVRLLRQLIGTRTAARPAPDASEAAPEA